MDEIGITPNTSNQQLLNNSDTDSAEALIQVKRPRSRENLTDVTVLEYVTVGILCFVNLINYMDRFTLAGILSDVQKNFSIGDDDAGLLQTVFVVAYMVFAPAFGYLGDRYSRRYIMAAGVALWCITTFVGSYMTNFTWFVMFRGLVGIGEASYSTIAPTIISDMFVGNLRSKMLAMFYFAIPVGSGLGYIVGSETAAAAGDWRWGLRVTPFLGVIAVVLITWVMAEPERGQAEESHIRPTSYSTDIRMLFKNPSFMLSTLAFTCVAFVTGALAFWGPHFLFLGLKLQPAMADVTLEEISLLFGVVTMLAGIIGVPLGTVLGASLVKKYPQVHPIICGVGLLVSAPCLIATIFLSEHSVYAPVVIMFFAQVALNLNWAIVADMSLYVVIPPRRSTAEAFQILVSHMFGDAGSPYLVGLISESLKYTFAQSRSPDLPIIVPDDRIQFKSLQYSLFITCFVEVLGGIFFLVTAVYIVKDKLKVDKAISDAEAQATEPRHICAQGTLMQPE